MVTKIGITGGAGFIGSNLASKISKQYEVLILDNFSTGRRDYLKDIKCHVRDVELSDASETLDSTKDLDVIFHLAASGNVVESINDPITNFNNNVLTTLNILEAARVNGIKRLIFSSTGGALMGKASPPVDEATQPAPISPYGASKLACESYIKVYAECYGLCYVIFRFGNVIGANSAHKKGVINTFYKQIKAGENIKVYGNVSRDFIDVDKLTDTMARSILSEAAANEIFHISSGKEVYISEVAEVCINELRKNEQVKILIENPRVGEVLRNFSDNTKAKQILKHESSQDSLDTIRKTLQWLIEND